MQVALTRIIAPCIGPLVFASVMVVGLLFAPSATDAQITGYELVTNQVLIPASSVANVNVSCSSGKKVLGGGFDIETPLFVQVSSSEPSDGVGNFSDHNWNVLAQNTDPDNARQVTVSAICALAQ